MSKDALDTANSVTWFFADASWMCGLTSLGLSLMALTIISGVTLLYIEKRLPVFFINCAICSWIGMNTLWMLSEHIQDTHVKSLSVVVFAAGCLFIGGSFLVSKNVRETFSHFRRFRLLRWGDRG